ncbi:MAG: cytidylate kinase-like family protein [Planctomycetes bacterium]|nr:cytidylate kinase-like family protein [Planctomycetota bacterium]
MGKKPTISSYIRDNLQQLGEKKEPGPFVTISRQYGCDGYELGDMLLKKLDEREDSGTWRLYKKEMLKQLVEDTGLTEEVIEKERLAKPSLLKDFLRGMHRSGIPDGYEIRNKITVMVRTVAFEGHAVIIGQGGTAATADLTNGLSIRVEAPKEWRVVRVCWREQLKRQGAIARIDAVEKERKHMRKLYAEKNPRTPAFNLTIDNSLFNIEQIADQIVFAMELKQLIEAK